jgi:predicted aldo/keto reductase-like oxidoreductase
MKTLAGGGFLDREKTKPINTTAAIKWVLSNPDIHSTIPGMTAFDHLDLNVKILTDITLSEQERKDIMLASSEPGLFCSGCQQCIPACRKSLPVPDLMRAYMYAYGYSNPSRHINFFQNWGPAMIIAVTVPVTAT